MGRFESISSIVMGNPTWAGWVLAGGIFFFLFLTYSTIRSPLPPTWKWGLFTLKILAVALLATCLLDPKLSQRHVRSGENIIVLLADQSASLEMSQSPQDDASRGSFFKSLLTDSESVWQKRLSQDFDVRRYKFGSAVGSVENFQSLTFEDPASRLATALRTIQTRYHGQPLAGVFLFTDGNSTDAIQEMPATTVPIFPVIPDETTEAFDISIDSVSVSQSNFEDAPVTIQGRFNSTGTRPEKIHVQLQEQGETGSKIYDQSVPVRNNGELSARFQIRPARPGVLFYELSVTPEFQEPSKNTEATLRNNGQLICVNRDPRRSRILYVGGRPNWEHKFLGRALAEEEQLSLVSLIRIAKKEARFDFRGRVGERNNSLFRGFNEREDETDDYSQPVLVRLNTRDAAELSDGFPKTKLDLYQYDALIIDDAEAAFFTRDQQSLIEKFVSERGGGVLMLGGRDTYQQGKWEHTPVADVLPVYLSRLAEPLSGKLKWSITRDGWIEPWTRSRETEQAEKARLNDAPSLTILTSTSDIKPGARVLATVEDEQGSSAPSLVVQNYGEGRTAALLVGDLWRWSLQEKTPDADDAGKFWRQLTRWLIGDVPGRIVVTAKPTNFGGLPATTICVRLRDKEYQPRDGDRVLVSVQQPDGSVVKLDAQPSLSAAGTYEAVHVSRQAGPYVATVSTADTEDDPLSASVGWASDPAIDEFRHANMNVQALKQIADDSGGALVQESELVRFVSDLPFREMPVMETESVSLWHRSWILLAALTLLTLEWGLRRWRGLA